MFAVVLLVLVFVGLGVLQLFAPNLMWNLQVLGNRSEGLKSERTEAWEIKRVISGIVLIIAGLVIAGWALSAQQWFADSQVAERDALVANLTDDFGGSLSTWEEVAAPTLAQVAFDEDDVEEFCYNCGISQQTSAYYGECTDGDFYLYVFSYGRRYDIVSFGGETRHSFDDFAFIPNGDPETCKPDGAFINDVEELGAGWYAVNAQERGFQRQVAPQ